MQEKIIKIINMLIVDDHHFIIEGYKNVINLYPDKNYQFIINRAVDCKSGYEMIMNADQQFDLAFFDISMPEYPEKEIFSGEDLAKLIKVQMPECKIVILTMHSERLKAEKIISEIDPNGLIIKNDLDFPVMMVAMETILKGEHYYSDAVITFLNEQQKEKVYVDVFNRQILHYLSKGVPANDVALYVPLSTAQAKDRIKDMKILIGKAKCSDKELVEFAKENGMMNR